MSFKLYFSEEENRIRVNHKNPSELGFDGFEEICLSEIDIDSHDLQLITDFEEATRIPANECILTLLMDEICLAVYLYQQGESNQDDEQEHGRLFLQVDLITAEAKIVNGAERPVSDHIRVEQNQNRLNGGDYDLKMLEWFSSIAKDENNILRAIGRVTTAMFNYRA